MVEFSIKKLVFKTGHYFLLHRQKYYELQVPAKKICKIGGFSDY